jgi:ribosomal subunit interface protein
MRVQVAGRHTDVGEALRTRITEELSGQIHKFFNRASDATVTVEKNGLGFDVDCALHLDSGITLQTQGHGGDAHAAFSEALGRLEKRVRRYKRRLRNHHADNKSPLTAETASAYVLAPLAEEEEAPPLGETAAEAGSEPPADAAPLVIAETKVQVRTMSVSTAVMQLDLTDAPALLFRNAAHGGLSMIYRRADGNIGWVDPERTG